MVRSGFPFMLLAPMVAFCIGLPSDGSQLTQAQTNLPAPAPDTPAQAAPAKPAAALTPETRGDIAMARKMYREAVDFYRSMPATAVTLNKIGIAYHQLLDLENARRYYERAVKSNPKYSEAINNLGTVFYSRKEYGRACRQYRRALKLAPDSASVYSNLGTAYFARKKYKEAFEAYQEALRLDPEVFEHRGSFGSLLQENTVEEKARYYFYLAKVYAKSGMTDRAILYVRKALEDGFKDRNKFIEDPEFATLQEVPEFKELMTKVPRVL